MTIIVIAEDINCYNVSTTMSPALTREHSQDVVDVKEDRCPSELANNTASLINSLSKPFFFPEQLEGKNGSDQPNCNGTKRTSLSLPKNGCTGEPSDVNAPNGNTNNNSSDESTLNHSSAIMTPRIALPCTSTAANLKSINVTRTIESVDGQACKPAEATMLPLISPVENPTLHAEDINKRNEDIEKKMSDILKRIDHWQEILASKQSTQKIKGLVRNHVTAASRTITSNSKNGLTISSQALSTDVNVCGDESSPKPSESGLCGLEQEQTNLKECTTKRGTKRTLNRDVHLLSAHLKQLQTDVDSEATDSSSGDDSDDESLRVSGLCSLPGGNSSQNIKKMPCWRWARDRAMIISRWTWLQAQVSDLEYKIRQHGELHKQLRSSKVSYSDQLAKSQALGDSSLQSAARCVPLAENSSSRHKFVRISQASALSRKARQHPIVKCQCLQTVRRCAICAGQHHYSRPPEIETLQKRERISHLDASFHPVLSFPQDVNPAIELEDIVSSNDRKLTATVPGDTKLFKDDKKEVAEAIKKHKLALTLKKSKDKQLKKSKKKKVSDRDVSLEYLTQKNKKKAAKLAKRARSNSHVPKTLEDEEELMEQEHAAYSLSQSVPAGAELNRSNTAGSNKRAYDIDDIVIPYHLAAATRVEKLQYKEIDTPRWREHLVNGSTVHEQLHRRSSSTSVPMTPVTPIAPSVAEMPVPAMESLSVDTTEPCAVDVATLTPASSACSLSNSEPSPSSPFAPEVEEDTSDARYIIRHNMMEAQEKSRYMNFVSSRRVRTQSVTIAGSSIRSSASIPLASPGSQVEEPIDVSTTSSDTLLANQISPTPLSASHDTTQLKDELGTIARRRSSSLTGSRLRKEASVDSPDEVIVHPYQQREFPLDQDELRCVTTGQGTSQRNNVQSNSNERWKVISTEEDNSGSHKHPLVLKLSKS